jgi:retron-type reverse transcriptase
MYEGLGRRRGPQLTAGVRAREIPVDAHEGDHWAFLRRHERAAQEAATDTRRHRADFALCLRDRAADLRCIRCAISILDEEPQKAAGPNGHRLADLDPRERLSLARAISQAIREGTYTPGDVRLKEIPKGNGTGTRTIAIANIEDRVALTSITQVLQPFLDPQFDENSFGFRPGRGREDALIQAEQISEGTNGEFWIVEDIADAFGRVPHRRLLEALQARELGTPIIDLVGEVISNETGRGLQQGSPLSPLLMNTYLDHALDRGWRRARPEMPLIRTADDLLVITTSETEANEAYEALNERLVAVGMPLKGTKSTSIRNIQVQDADWLGYRIHRRNGNLETRIGQKAWIKLEERLRMAHLNPKAPIRANETTHGWITQQGAPLTYENREAVLSQVLRTAERWGFDEVTPASELQFVAGDAVGKYAIRRRLFSVSLLASSAGGSAHQHRFSQTDGGEALQMDVSSPSHFRENIEWEVFVAATRIDGSPGTPVGSLRVHRRTRERQRRVQIDGRPYVEPAVLSAVVDGLTRLESPGRIQLWVPQGTLLANLSGHEVRPENLRRTHPVSGRPRDGVMYRRLADLFGKHQVTVRAY